MRIQSAAETFQALKQGISAVVRGKDPVIEMALVAVVAGGHVLLEDVPGVGKTTLARTLAAALGGAFRRIQFTSDLLPGDITGVNVLNPDNQGFSFRPGPLFAHVVLADEINRATPKTQSALLEAMGERMVTVDGTGHPLPAPFTVLATQNPGDFHGTFPLPESQLDRFLLRLEIGYPDREAERAILQSGGVRGATMPDPVSAEALRGLLDAVDLVGVHGEVEDYLLDLIAHTRTDARLIRGASTRGAEALYQACKALAVANGRGFVTPEDVRTLAVPVLAHRVLARAPGERGAGGRAAIDALLWELSPPQ